MTEEETKNEQYFLHLSFEYQAKNNLQKEISKMFNQLDGALVDDIGELKAWLDDAISKLNDKYPRCKSINYSLRLTLRDAIAIDGLESCAVYLYPVIQKFTV